MDERFTTLMPGAPAIAGRDSEAAHVHPGGAFRTNPAGGFHHRALPFGRTAFGFELEPLLGAIRRGLRPGSHRLQPPDVLVEKRDPPATRRGCWKPSTGGLICC